MKVPRIPTAISNLAPFALGVLFSFATPHTFAGGETGPYVGPVTSDALSLVASSTQSGLPNGTSGTIICCAADQSTPVWQLRPGGSWTQLSLGPDEPTPNDLLWNGQRFVLIGTFTDPLGDGYPRPFIATLEDSPGAQWIRRLQYQAPGGGLGNDRFEAIAAHGDTVLAVGTGGLRYKSTDAGLTWTELSAYQGGGLSLTSLARMGTRWVSQEGIGKICLSYDDGVTWQDFPVPPFAQRVKYLHGRFFGFTSSYQFNRPYYPNGDATLDIWTSTDGIAWSKVFTDTFLFNELDITSPSYTNGGMSDITWTGFEYGVLGNGTLHLDNQISSGFGGVLFLNTRVDEFVWCSPDGVNWAPRIPFPPPQNQPGINHYFVTNDLRRIYVCPISTQQRAHAGFARMFPPPGPFANDPDYLNWTRSKNLAPALSDYAEDPDGDGYSNQLEFAWQTDPTTPTPGGFSPSISREPGGVVVYSYRGPAGDGWSWSVERSATLAPNSWTQEGLLDATTEYLPSNFLIHQRWDVSTAPKNFFRTKYYHP